jgi:hypothetical protein
MVDASMIPARLPKRRGIPRDAGYVETRLGFFDAGSRRKVAVVVTSDGRRVHVPIEPERLDVALLDLLRSLPGLDSLLGLITGSRRDRGTRRDERR